MSTIGHTSFCDMGIERQWNSADRVAVTGHNSSRWLELKRENGWLSTPVGEIPGFRDSLQRLYNQGYSPSDISAFFGVSRERVRQWFNQLGIVRDGVHGSMVRVWDDERNRFAAVHPRQLHRMKAEVHQKRIDANRADIHYDNALRANADVDTLRRISVALGRPAYRAEMLDALGCPDRTDKNRRQHIYVDVARRWGWSQRAAGLTYSDAWKLLYRAAGIRRLDGRAHPINTAGRGHTKLKGFEVADRLHDERKHGE